METQTKTDDNPFEVSENDWPVEGEILSCGCCGKGITHTKEQNAHFGVVPCPDDKGFGMCLDCGGNPKSRKFEKKIGWAAKVFYDTRILILREHLEERIKTGEEKAKKMLEKLNSLTYERKCLFVAECIRSGALSW